MAATTTDPAPPALLVAVGGAALAALTVFAFGIGSLFAGHGAFSVGIGGVLILYSLLLALGAWLGWRRHPLARGLIVAPALLNLATAVSLLSSTDLAQRVGAGAALAVVGATVVAAVLPGTGRALRPGRP